MKWINNGVKYERGNHEFLIAKYDETDVWFTVRANIATQQTQKALFKRLGEYIGASKCEVLPMYDDNDNWTKGNIVVFDFMSSGECRFWRLNEDGSMIKIAV